MKRLCFSLLLLCTAMTGCQSGPSCFMDACCQTESCCTTGGCCDGCGMTHYAESEYPEQTNSAHASGSRETETVIEMQQETGTPAEKKARLLVEPAPPSFDQVPDSKN